MIHYQEKRFLKYPQKGLFHLVLDVQKYPEFLPWVLKAHVHPQKNEMFLADLDVGYKLFRETYTSEVTSIPFEKIEVKAIKGPFDHLVTLWNFKKISDTETEISFQIDLKIKSSLFSSMLESVFSQASNRILSAFEKRAENILCPDKKFISNNLQG